jgi:hypothetical protein
MSNRRFFFALMIIILLASATYAFAAANSVPESGAGDGSGNITGYTITNIDYTLAAANPANIQTVEFDIAPTAGAAAARTVSIQLNGGAWYSCAVAAGHATCNIGGAVTVLSANSLRVIAAE